MNREKLDVLIRRNEGKRVPEELRPWFILARELRSKWREEESLEIEIAHHQSVLKDLEEQRECSRRLQHHLADAMNKLLDVDTGMKLLEGETK